MALTATEINKIARILGTTKRYLNAHIENLGDDLTAQDETDIRAEITRWDAGAGVDFTYVHPNVKNFGAEIDAEDVKRDIRRNIAVLLDFDVSAYYSSGVGTVQIGL
jgi:hypothetical protein